MAVSQFGQENYIANGLGIPAHDFIENSYESSTNNLIAVEYKLGGSSGTVVARLDFTYDSSGNLLTVERTA
tara:strand:+ start:2229 stop:2441 length:213 start_codon:yes stop_codon:yes gene_type:complete